MNFSAEQALTQLSSEQLALLREIGRRGLTIPLVPADPDKIRYRSDPVAYAWEKRGIWLWGKLAEVARAIVQSPHRVMAKSANGIGKTTTSALLADWFYDCFDPGECIITGPRFDQIKDTTFKEIRRFRKGDPGLLPKAPRLESSPDHYINGTTANTGDAFQGIHSESIMLLFEEAMGIDAIFWEAARGIRAGGKAFWFAYCNPTDPTGHAFTEEQSGNWSVFSISAFEHPNIAAELTDNAAPIPGAVRLTQLAENMRDWADQTVPWPSEHEAEATDVDLYDPATYGVKGWDGAAEIARGVHVPIAEVIEGAKGFFPGRFWRPGPVGEARILGRYPKHSAYAIFSEAQFVAALNSRATWGLNTPVTLGCDVARFGDDATSIHVRRGPKSLRHITYHKQDTDHTIGVMKELAREFAAMCQLPPQRVPMVIDDTGVGGGVVDGLKGWSVTPVNFQQLARDEEKYPNARSEMLFDLAEKMAAGQINTSELASDQRDELRRQAIGVKYSLDNQGRRVAEPSKDIKKRLGRSPDDLVAFSLAYYEVGHVGLKGAKEVPMTPSKPFDVRDERRQDEKPRERVAASASPFMWGQKGGSAGRRLFG